MTRKRIQNNFLRSLLLFTSFAITAIIAQIIIYNTGKKTALEQHHRLQNTLLKDQRNRLERVINQQIKTEFSIIHDIARSSELTLNSFKPLEYLLYLPCSLQALKWQRPGESAQLVLGKPQQFEFSPTLEAPHQDRPILELRPVNQPSPASQPLLAHHIYFVHDSGAQHQLTFFWELPAANHFTDSGVHYFLKMASGESMHLCSASSPSKNQLLQCPNLPFSDVPGATRTTSSLLNWEPIPINATTGLGKFPMIIAETKCDQVTVLPHLTAMQRAIPWLILLCGFAAVGLRQHLRGKRLFRRLKRSENRYLSLVETPRKHFFIFVYDPNGRITYTSPAIKDILGVTPRQFANHPFHSFDLDESKKQFMRSIYAPEAPDKSHFYVMRAHHQDGTIRWLEIMEIPVYNENNEIVEVEAIATDMTARRRALDKLRNESRQSRTFKRQLNENNEMLDSLLSEAKTLAAKAEEAGRLKAQFMDNMSHEIRTPMNGAIGLTQLLIESNLTSEQRDLASSIDFCHQSLMGIINNLLDFASLENGNLNLHAEPLDLAALLTKIGQKYRKRAHMKNLQFMLQLDPFIPERLLVDQVRLTQVLEHLLDNALKFTKTGTIRLHCQVINTGSQQCELQFRVEDTGSGISQARIFEVFKGFTQLDGSNTRESNGLGIGLTLAYQMVNLMHGNLEVESKVDEGSQFHFTVPFLIERRKVLLPHGHKLNRRAQDANRDATPHILLIDNRLSQAVKIKKHLMNLHSKISLAHNELDAKKAMLNHAFHLIFINLSLQEQNAYDLSWEIFNGVTTEIPIIGLSEAHKEFTRKSTSSCGLRAIIPQNIDLEAFTKTIEQFTYFSADELHQSFSENN